MAGEKMEGAQVSPKFTIADLNEGRATQVDIFEDQIQGCILGFAQRLVGDEHSGIAVLMLCTSVFEPLGSRILEGNQSDKDCFYKGCQYVFGDHGGKTFERLYKYLRCGLYHEGFIKMGLVLSNDHEALSDEDGMLRINPLRFLETTEAGVKRYIAELRATNSSKKGSFDSYLNRSRDRQNKQFRAQSPNSKAIPSRPGTTLVHIVEPVLPVPSSQTAGASVTVWYG